MERKLMKIALSLSLSLLVAIGSISAMNKQLEKDPAFQRLSAQFNKLDWVKDIKPGCLSFDDFMLAAGNNIKKAISEIVTTVNAFATPPNPTQTFTQYIEECRVLADTIKTEVLDRLKAEIEVYAERNACESCDYRILELTHKIVTDFYAKFQKIYQILANHRRSSKASDPAALVGVLKPQLLALVSAASLTSLDADLASLEKLLTDRGLLTVSQDIKDLRALLSKVKGSVGVMTPSEEMEMLAKIRKRLKKL